MNSDAENSPGAPESPPQPRGFSWFLVLAFLLAPAILTSLTVLVDRSSKSPAPGVALIGGLLGGLGTGILVGRRLGRTPGLQLLFSLIFTAIGAVASITIATFGCLATGYQLDFR